MTKIDNEEKIYTKERTKFPYCYANYCENHDSCQQCEFKESCMQIKQPKEPEWCQ